MATVSATTPPVGGDPYDLSGFSIPHTVTWPTAPVTTSTINVTANNGSQLASAVQTAGARVIVPAGTYNTDLNFTANDVDLVMDNGATVVGEINFSSAGPTRPNRIRWTGGNQTGSTINLYHINDLLVNDVYFTTSTGTWGAINQMSGGSFGDDGWSRVAFVNVTIDHQATDGAGDWAWYTQGYTGALQEDLILANVKLMTNGSQNNRFQSIRRFVCVDSAFNPDFGSTNGLRTGPGGNGACQDLYFDNVVINEGYLLNYTGAQNVLRGHFKNIDRYHDGGFFNFADNLASNTGSVENIRGYGSTGTPPASPGGFGGLTDLGGHSTGNHSYLGTGVPSLPDGTLMTAVGAIR